jgi:hypothetical protein
MKKIILLLSLLVVSMFLIGCSENLAGEAYRSSRTNADGLINTLADKEQQSCKEERLRDCPRASEENVYALLARSNVFAKDLVASQLAVKQRSFNAFKKNINNYLGILRKVASGEGSNKDKLIAKAIIGNTYASTDLETQADILIIADLIAANKLRVSPEDMATVNKMLGSDLLKGISKAGPGIDASTGAMGSLIPSGASQSFFDCVQAALGSKSGGSPQQAPDGGASDPLMPVGPDGDFGGNVGGVDGAPTMANNKNFDATGCDEALKVKTQSSISEGTWEDSTDNFLLEGETTTSTSGDSQTAEIYTKSTNLDTGYVLEQKQIQTNTGDSIEGSQEVWVTDPSGEQIFYWKLETNSDGSTGETVEGSWPDDTGFFNPEGNLGNIFGCPAVNAVEKCMEAAGSADICTGLESTGEQGQVAMILENFCNSATGAEIDGSLFDQSVIINPGNMINQAYLINFFGFTQTQLGDLYSQS